MPARSPTNKKNEPTARAARVEEIRKEISECLDNAKRAYKADKFSFEELRAERYQAKKLRQLADAALLIEENPQQAEIHFRKTFGKSGFDWIENLKLLAAHRILTDLCDQSYREAARNIISIRPAVAKLANENQIVNLRKKIEHLPPKAFAEPRPPNDFVGPLQPYPLSLAGVVWRCIWEDAPRDWHPIDFAYYLILLTKLPG